MINNKYLNVNKALKVFNEVSPIIAEYLRNEYVPDSVRVSYFTRIVEVYKRNFGKKGGNNE